MLELPEGNGTPTLGSASFLSNSFLMLLWKQFKKVHFSGSYVLHQEQGLNESRERMITLLTVHFGRASDLASKNHAEYLQFFLHILSLLVHEYYNITKV